MWWSSPTSCPFCQSCSWNRQKHLHHKINRLVQDCSNSSALAMELLQSCNEPSKYHLQSVLFITWSFFSQHKWPGHGIDLFKKEYSSACRGRLTVACFIKYQLFLNSALSLFSILHMCTSSQQPNNHDCKWFSLVYLQSIPPLCSSFHLEWYVPVGLATKFDCMTLKELPTTHPGKVDVGWPGLETEWNDKLNNVP